MVLKKWNSGDRSQNTEGRAESKNRIQNARLRRQIKIKYPEDRR